VILQEIWLAWQDLDEFSLWSILAKSLAYWTTLLAAGSALNLLWLRETAPQTISLLRWFGPTCATFAILLNSTLIPLQASYLMGEWSAVQDPMMLQVAWESPLGDSLLLRGIGLLLLLVIIRPNSLALGISTIGCGLVALSFAFQGHTISEPRWLLVALITVHLLGLIFWIGGFVPLMWLAKRKDTVTGAAARQFGKISIWNVLLLALAGAELLWLLTEGNWNVIRTAYGQLFAFKLLGFLGLLGLAALNKLFLTPALLRGEVRAFMLLRLSVTLEMSVAVIIFLLTATLTTVGLG
jgi:putative copper resistance protein D